MSLAQTNTPLHAYTKPGATLSRYDSTASRHTLRRACTSILLLLVAAAWPVHAQEDEDRDSTWGVNPGDNREIEPNKNWGVNPDTSREVEPGNDWGVSPDQSRGSPSDSDRYPEREAPTPETPSVRGQPGRTRNPNEAEEVTRWKPGPNDLDWRGSAKTVTEAVNEAFKRTGVPREHFKVTKWGKNAHGKSFPVEWRAKGGAVVNLDLGHRVDGPGTPHVGYQSPGKRSAGAVRGHILLDDIPANR